MGYFIKNIAHERTSPAKVSLSNNPNFVEFEAVKQEGGIPQPIRIGLKVKKSKNDEGSLLDAETTKIEIYEAAAGKYSIKGTYDKNEVDKETFFIDKDSVSITAENIRDCFLKQDFFKSNYNIYVQPVNDENNVICINNIIFESKGVGQLYNVDLNFNAEFIKPDRYSGSIDIGDDYIWAESDNYDLINPTGVDINIELDMFRNTGIFLGGDDKPATIDKPFGEYLATLVKSYNNEPIWFDVNSLMKNNRAFSTDFLDAEGWSDAGTVSDLRFIAKRSSGYSRDTFYVSNVLYTINGYDRNLEINDLSAYVYDLQSDNEVKPLTKQPILTHIKGQIQYFNFIFSNPERGKESTDKLGILFKVCTQSKKTITDNVIRHELPINQFQIANTVKLDIDSLLTVYPNAGYIEARLCFNGQAVSKALVFKILPECLYRVNDFAFLNSLGGWSSFNFPGTESANFKTSASTVFKTQTPAHIISSEIESVYSKEVEEQFAVQTMPISKEIAEWLKEMSATTAAYELATKRYIIIDEMNIKPNSKDQLFRVEMKYRYSDKFNASV